MNTTDDFWRQVKVSDGCWLWSGRVSKYGYGRFRFEGREWSTHRLSWKLSHDGEAPASDKAVCHRCDTPACVRPDHLFLGSQAENMADMTSKGRRLGVRNNAKLSIEQVLAIRRRYFDRHIRQVDLAKEFGITQGQVSAIVNRKSGPA